MPLTGEAPAHVVLGYVRPLPAAEEPLDAAVQRAALRACARGEGLGAIEIYEESGQDGRLAFAHLAEALVHAQAAARTHPRRSFEQEPTPIVVATLDVLGDAALEQALRLLWLSSGGARVVFADGRAPEDALRAGWSGRADQERRRDRVREGMRAKALRGVVLGRPPYGYAVEERVLVPHPREAAIVQRLFREYLEGGEGLRRIAAGLNRDGVKTHLGRAWTPGAVRTVLRNPVYTGLYRRLGVVVPAAHPPLIDRATFGATQRRMAERRTSRLDQQRHDYAFAGLLRCGRCGAPMTGERRPAKGGEAIHYRCVNATSRGTCGARGYREELIDSAVREDLERTRAGAVAIGGRAPGAKPATRRRLERQLTEAIEHWYGGEWRFPELVARAAPTVVELAGLEAPEGMDPPEAGADAARMALLAGWDTLSVAERAGLLRTTLAEVVVQDGHIRVVRRR